MSQPSWFEHVDLIQVLLTAALGYIVWSFRRWISTSEGSIKDLYSKYNKLNEEFHTLLGEHKGRRIGAKSGFGGC